ncbi:MAG: hypothetical protein JSW51_11140, partial [Gemmatimonadota bacterium]
MGDERQTNLGFLLLCILSLLFLASVANGQQVAQGTTSVITNWELSRPYPADRMNRDDYPGFFAIFGANWQQVAPDPAGLLDFTELVQRDSTASNLVLIRTRVDSDEAQDMTLSLTYRADIDLFLNGSKVLAATGSDSEAEGPGSSQEIELRLKQGLNEIFMMVTETASGWE